MIRRFASITAVSLAFCSLPLAAKDKPLLQETFAGTELGEGWSTNYGHWRPVEGALRGTQVPTDNHGAAARYRLPLEDGEFKMRFRLLEGAKAFHFGFDPAPGELKKRGHLFSVIVTPKGWKILKHLDKDSPESDPNEVLAEEARPFKPGKWHSLVVVKQKNEVTATLDEKQSLKATHPTFHVKTPTLVFRSVGGEGIEVDELEVRPAP